MLFYIDTYLQKMLETKSATTVKGHKSTLLTFNKFVEAEEPIEVLTKDVVRFRNEMFKQKKSGTVNTMLKRVKLFFTWCEEQGLIDESPAKEVKLLTEAEALPKWLSEGQEDMLVKAVKRKYLGSNVVRKSYRELAVIMLMLKAGLRVGEVTNLKHEDIIFTDKSGMMLIRGKGQQQRNVPMIPELADILKKYIENHGIKGEYVFFSQMSDQLSERRIQDIMKEFRGVKGKNGSLEELHPHILRHTFAHNLAVQRMPLESIARVLGHMKQNGEPNINITIRYTKANEQEIASDMERILSSI